MDKQPKVFLINLDKSKDRLEKSATRLAEHGVSFERISAVYGADLSEQEIAQHYSVKLNNEKFFRPLGKGEIGCYFSHRLAWQKIVDQQLPYGIVLEDDFRIVGDLSKVFNALDGLNGEWELVKLASYQNRVRPIKARKKIDEHFDLVVNTKAVSGCCAQAITLKGAKKLLAATDKFGRPVDTDIQHIWETKVPVFALMPFYIEQDMEFESDIAAVSQKKEKKSLSKKLKAMMKEKVMNFIHTSKVAKRLNQGGRL